MTRKDYVLIALSVRSVVDWPDVNLYKASYALNSVVNELCSHLQNDNPRFDKSKFRKACGL